MINDIILTINSARGNEIQSPFIPKRFAKRIASGSITINPRKIEIVPAGLALSVAAKYVARIMLSPAINFQAIYRSHLQRGIIFAVKS